MNPIVYKIVVTVIALLISAAAGLGLLDHFGERYTEQAFERAIITFGVARGLNAVISVAQGTEVAIHPAGFGVNFTPGQILDPINDLIEQFSWVMLASSASLGIQKIFLSICSSWPVTLTLMVLLLVWLWGVWRSVFPVAPGRWLTSALLILLFIRFSVPVAAIAGEVFYRYFLSEQYQEATQQLEQTKEAISSLNANFQNFPEPQGMLDRAKGWFDSAMNLMDLDRRLEAYKQAATDASRHAINLTVVFLIQTVIFPILFLWVIYRFLRNFSLFRQ
ncbi:MAG: hypothetical protein OEZ68_16540 [Gammaproteobacteria bacterium]|nr:hypothetical protein [Gammaproteobacteria bacterium]MDH5802411.1 hypothetical protein [Gammaproteobacteria bacterium]